MDKELPSSGSGRSAFTVFGFGNSDRYTNFDSPLESGENVESFNATNSIAFPSRPSSKSKKRSSMTNNVGEVYKMSPASASNKSQLILQSLLPSGSIGAEKKPSEGYTGSHSAGDGLEKPGGRRYSEAQSGGREDITEVRDRNTDQLLQMFSSSVHSSHSKMQDQGNRVPLDASDSDSQHTALSSSGGLRRQGSSPVLSSMAHQQGSILQGFLKRNASSSALYTVSESSTSSIVPASQGSLSSSNTEASSTTTGALQVHKAEATLAPPVTNPPSTSSNIDTLDPSGRKRKGFGILSRTRQFGAWLGKMTQGEKVEVTKKDVNVFAPTSF